MNKVKEKLKEAYAKIFGFLFFKAKIVNKVLFINFNGKGYGDNPKSICEYLRTNYPDIQLVWLSDSSEGFPKEVKVIKYGSIRAFWEQATSKVWVYNTRSFIRIPKKIGQYYIQTWHASVGFKNIERAVESTLPQKYVKDAKYDGIVTDLLVSDSQIQTEYFKKYFWYTGEIIRCGLPRNDELYYSSLSDSKKENYKTKLHLPKFSKVVLYAPTFRDNGNVDYLKINFERLRDSFQKNIESEVYLLIRLHPNDSEMSSSIQFSDKIIDVTNFGDMQELLVVADVLISDYSSSILDFILLEKPYIRFANDLEEYTSYRELTNLYYELPDEIVKDVDSLYSYSINFWDNFDYSMLKEFKYKYISPVFDGKASERVSQRIVHVLGKYYDEF
ncbi:CDP-glycerol glycerophosphotransferase family protein [Streptococcus equinus]|uniref:CDP-glycerol glycerophosphotransferase family protein n=1 Tax=Streptococcus equinus TaxID=1335 RepID=UPI000DFADC63|nr:CDP-glycerol glycerophosphotransferase family protein [Streptococcus equinus]SUO79934.1 CDP-glycerol:poly(glycerophosphate) glycerophosphotransferase [Streptococcus equinus]